MTSRLVYGGFLKVLAVETEQGTREVVKVTDSVCVLLHLFETQHVLLVNQARAPMVCEDNPTGLITETVAGRFDVNLGPKELAIKEAKEEVGAHIDSQQVMLLNQGKPMALSAGVLTELCYLTYVRINPCMIENTERVFGNKDEGEQIKRIFMSVKDFLAQPCEDLRVFAYQQWLMNHMKEVN